MIEMKDLAEASVAIVKAQVHHVAEVCTWLSEEHTGEGGGLYDNAHMLPKAQAEGRLYCFLSAEMPVGFVVVHEVSGSISLLEVHPGHRRKGLGKQLASYAIALLLSGGAACIEVECTSRESESLFRSLGFRQDSRPPKSPWSNPKLRLRAPC